MNSEISGNVVSLLIKELQRLSPNLQLALKSVSCIGSSVLYSIVDILSQDLQVNLRDLLSLAVQKGFMVHVDESSIRFAHDKIQQGTIAVVSLQCYNSISIQYPNMCLSFCPPCLAAYVSFCSLF